MRLDKYLFFTFIFLFVVADQVSKSLILNSYSLGESLEILFFLKFTLVFNDGIAFSILEGSGEIMRWVFVTLVLLILVYLFKLALFSKNIPELEKLSFLFIISGGLGNLIDRVFYGYVIDFIHLFLNDYSFYIFNLADSFITIGAIIYILSIFLNMQKSNEH
tara:strand:+ start:5683 stop:6168 length:486 start_codon:yes stop_codon:yes gene_type:complete